MVEVTKDGKHFFRDTNGNITMVNKDDQPEIDIDENGN